MTQRPRPVRLLAVLGALLLALAACSGSSADDADASATTAADGTDTDTGGAADPGATIVVEHALGTTEVPATVESVVSASVSLTGHLLAIDAPLVATGATPPSELTDDQGRFLQWADEAEAQDLALLSGPAPDVEEILDADPDLVVAAFAGADALSQADYDVLSQQVPTIVFDHTASTWQELVARMGEAIGHDEQAAAVVEEFDALVAATAPTLDTSHPVAAFTTTPEGYGVFTTESPHGRLLTELGLEVVESSAEGSAGDVPDRPDVTPVAFESSPDVFGDATLLFVLADDATVDQALADAPLLADLPGPAEGRTVALGFESFRLDPYSATHVVEVLGEDLAA